MTTRSRTALPALTGARFIAAAHVLLFHFGKPLYSAGPAGLRNVFDAGYTGVSLFFVLSGFILTYAHVDLEATGTSRLRFWQARIARVFPNHIVALCAWCPIAVWLIHTGHGAFSGHETALAGAASVFLLQAWWPAWAMVWNFPAWSLSVELFFYAVFPWAIGHFRSSRSVFGAMLLCFVAALLAPVGYLFLNPDGLGQPCSPGSSGIYITWLKFFPLFHLPTFLSGMFLGLLFLRRKAGISRFAGPLLSIGAAFGLVAVLRFSDKIPYPLLHNGLLAPLFGAAIFGIALGGGPVSWVLSRPVLVKLGEASYALYVFQAIVGNYLAAVTQRLAPTLQGSPLLSGVTVFSSIIVSLLIHRLVEKPGRMLVNSLFSLELTGQVG